MKRKMGPEYKSGDRKLRERHLIEAPEIGRIYWVKFQRRIDGVRLKAGMKLFFLLSDRDWKPWGGVEYEVKIVKNYNPPNFERNWLGKWIVVPVDAERDQKAYLLKRQQEVFDNVTRDPDK